MSEELEKVIEERIKPILEDAMSKYLGITVDEIEEDITDKIKSRPLLDFPITTNVPFKDAKKHFKKHYLSKLLRMTGGNIQDASKLAGLDRRSIHRLIVELKIEVDDIRESSPKIAYIREQAMRGIIEHTLDSYKKIIVPERLEEMYNHTGEITQNILKQLPDRIVTLKRAEQDFEREYIKQALEENNHNISKTARKIDIRFETLHRKMKTLGLN